MDIKKNY